MYTHDQHAHCTESEQKLFVHTPVLLELHFDCFVVVTCTGGRGRDDKGVSGTSSYTRVGWSSKLLIKLKKVDGSCFLQSKLRSP